MVVLVTLTKLSVKGIRLPEAAVFVDRELSRGFKDAESWTKDTFQTTVSEHLDSVRCAGVVSHGKFVYLQKLPWLIARIFVWIHPSLYDLTSMT